MIYQWAVIGAGPAGIAAVGNLLDQGVSENTIIWIDPKFHVGDLGALWQNVPSNTKVGLFLKFLNACQAFEYQKSPMDFAINHADHDKSCYLRLIVEPLQWITEKFKQRVHTILDFANTLEFSNSLWNIELSNSSIQSKNVILATGAEPKNLEVSNLPTIALQAALDKELIKKHIHRDDTVAVFGSSHSAILVLQNLVENNVKQIINFYLRPLIFAIYLKNWILFDDTGLKGPTADWARRHIDEELPKNLTRIYGSEQNVKHYLQQCDKIIYAIGFERRALPIIKGFNEIEYIKECGIIAPGLFGIGIAFPEAKYNPLRILEYRVGLWKFMEYLKRIMPIWLQYTA